MNCLMAMVLVLAWAGAAVGGGVVAWYEFENNQSKKKNIVWKIPFFFFDSNNFIKCINKTDEQPQMIVPQ